MGSVGLPMGWIGIAEIGPAHVIDDNRSRPGADEGLRDIEGLRKKVEIDGPAERFDPGGNTLDDFGGGSFARRKAKRTPRTPASVETLQFVEEHVLSYAGRARGSAVHVIERIDYNAVVGGVPSGLNDGESTQGSVLTSYQDTKSDEGDRAAGDGNTVPENQGKNGDYLHHARAHA